MAGYGWTTYDARNGGVQTISDPGNAVNLTVEFVKFHDQLGDWSVRVKGIPLGDVGSWNMSVIFYLGIEDEDSGMTSDTHCSSSLNGKVNCQGDATGLGQYSTLIPAPEFKTERTVLRSMRVAKGRLWEAKSFLLGEKTWPSTLPKIQTNSSNLHYVQRHFEASFSLEIHFTSSRTAESIPAEIFTNNILNTTLEFQSRFNTVFRPNQLWLTKDYTEFSRSLLSNLMGAIGYFYGEGRINRHSVSSTPSPPEKSHKHFTMVPSRSSFPRGFLWDEGFHLLVVINWDLDLALEILQSWFDLMDEDGWIAREQILGPEARSKVLEEFQIQDVDYANPPTLFLVVGAFLDIISGQKSYGGAKSVHVSTARDFLVQLYPKLKTHYEWWRKTQRQDSGYLSHDGRVYHGYGWKGQTVTHALTSGLDDYPRTSPPGPHDIHVDALSWISLMADILGKVAEYLGEAPDLVIFREQREEFDRSMEFLHWSKDDQPYCDATKRNDLLVHECHKGYISLFPFLLSSWNVSHPHLNATLNLMRDGKELWSPFGLRSLSRSDKIYGTEENYWRGPIWININYLALVKLLELARANGPYPEIDIARTMYINLRRNIISTVYESWNSTGFAWEQYNAETGSGQGAQGFTGWTALLVNLLAMPDFSDAAIPATTPRSWFEDTLEILWAAVMVFLFVGLFAFLPCVLACRERRRYSGYTGIRRDAVPEAIFPHNSIHTSISLLIGRTVQTSDLYSLLYRHPEPKAACTGYGM